MDLLSRNLQLLKHKDRDLFNRLKKVSKAPYISFVPSKSGKIVAEVFGKDGKKYLLHSSYDPVAEAEGVASKVNWSGVSHVLVFGFGCGYQIPAILSRVTERVKVYAVDPDISLFRSVLEVIDLTEILSRPNLHLIVGLSPSMALEAIMRTLDPREIKAIEFFKHPVYYRLLPDYFLWLERELNESIRIALVNLITALEFSFKDQRNTILNLRYLLSGSPVKNLFGAFRGKPAVVVCAGPSLDKNVHYLYEVRDRAIIIAVDTALRPLLEREIKPHIVVAGDPQDANFDHFRMICPMEVEDVFLVLDLRVSPLIFNHWRGKIFICDFGSQIMKWITSFLGEFGRLSVWGSVSTVAISLAVELGCDPVILLGQDLSFTGLRRYASYTWIDETSSNSVSPESDGLLKEKDLWGRDVWTAKNMLTYKDWLDQFFRKVKRTFINATEGGILREGVEVNSFIEASQRFLKASLDASDIIKRSWNPLRKNERLERELISKLTNLKEVIRSIVKICEEALYLLGTLYGKIDEEVKEKEEKLKSVIKTFPFLEEGFLPHFLSFNRQIESIRGELEDVALKREFEAYVFLFAGIKDIALKYLETIESSMASLREGR